MAVNEIAALDEPLDPGRHAPMMRFVIVSAGRPLTRKRSNGQTFVLCYRDRARAAAHRALGLARSTFPDAEVIDLWRT